MTKLIGLGDLFKNTWAIYREKFTLVVGLMILPFLLMMVNQLLTTTENGFILPLAFIIGIIAAIGLIWGSAGLIIVLRDRSRIVTIKEAYGLGWSKLISLIWVSILTGFIIGGSILLFVIPGIILATWLMFAKIIVVAEEEKGMSAVVKSREYVKDYFWPVLGRSLVIAIAVMVIYFILMAIVSLIVGAFIGFGSASAATLIIILTAVVNILVVPLAFIWMYLLYENLKQVKGSVTVDPAKKQGTWYLVIGLIGWVFIIVMLVFFMSVLASLLMGLFVGQALNGLNSQAVANLSTSTLPAPTSLPANLTPEQQQQLQTQLEAMRKLQDRIKQLKGNLPANAPAQ
ncbi:MAG: hypothetical protein WC640_03405 [Candidatus Paceibacterota bacterium]